MAMKWKGNKPADGVKDLLYDTIGCVLIIPCYVIANLVEVAKAAASCTIARPDVRQKTLSLWLVTKSRSVREPG
jgi:hypothetical protein